MGISGMSLEVTGVINRVIASVTISTAARHTFIMVYRATISQGDKRTVGSGGMTVLAGTVRIMDNCLDIAAVAGCRTVGSTGQH
jgi:hypothetical protein